MARNQKLEEVRLSIKSALSKVQGNQKIKYGKDELEMLLFDRIRIGGKIVKLPVWSGEFLSKLDLSEVDFSDVFWDFLSTKLKEEYPEIKEVCYSNTNAKIDLGKMYKLDGPKKYKVKRCNFENTDLSTTKIEGPNRFISSMSNFKKTGLKLNSNTYLFTYASNFENTDLSEVNINAEQMLKDYLQYGSKVYNDFHNSGIQLTVEESKLEELKKKENFFQMLYDNKRNNWGRCTFNGEAIANKRTEQEDIALIQDVEKMLNIEPQKIKDEADIWIKAILEGRRERKGK